MTTVIKRLAFCLALLVSMLAGTAKLSATLPAQDGDVFLCIRATSGLGANTGILVNIGPATNYTTASGLVNVDLGNTPPGSLLTDLENTFGTDWHTRPDVSWSVSGAQVLVTNDFPANTMFASRGESSPGVQSTPWTSPSVFGAGNPAGRMQSMRNAYANGTITDKQNQSTNTSKGLIQNPNADLSYVSYMPGGANTVQSTAFSYFNGAGGIENTFANGAPSSVVDFYKLVPGSGAGVLVGGFRLSASGQLAFSTDISFFQGPAQAKFGAATQSISESDASGKVTVNIMRTGNTNSAFTLSFSTSDGNGAVAGTDYVAHTNTPVVFASGETSKSVDVTIVDRPGFQGNRTFNATIVLTSGSAEVINPSTTEITINESTPQPAILALSAATYSIVENDASGKVTVTINRSGATNTAASATLSTQNGTAIGGVDFTAQTNTPVSFAPDEVTKTIDVLIADRADFQGDRSFTVSLGSPGAQTQLGAQSSATITIQDNETNPAGVVEFSEDNYRFAAFASGGVPNTIVITLVRSNGDTGAISVDVTVASGGTLTAGEDFTFTNPKTVNFGDGESFVLVNIPLLPGAAPVPGTINLHLSNATNGATVGAADDATVTVTTPDRVLPKLVVTSPRNGKGTANFDVVGSVQDADNIDRVEVRLNGGAPQNATLGVPGSSGTPFSLNGLQSENGPNVLTVQAFDVNGTGSKIVKVSFTYVNERPQFAGSYNGLIVPTGATPPANNLNNASGFVTLKVTSTGAFSGKVMIGGATLPIAGVFANDQTARFKATPSYTESVALASKGAAAVTFGDLSLSIAAGEITGTLGGVATLTADRAAFDGKTPATTPDPDHLANKGNHTAVFPSKPQAVLTSTQFPQGDGVGNIVVTKQGKVTFKGRLADGTAVTMSAPLSSDLEAPLFVSLYGKKGSIAGKIAFDKTQSDSDVEGSDFLWIRPQQDKAKNYTAGWPNGVKVDLIGARYAPGDFTVGNATFTAEDGNLTGAVTKTVSIAAKNKVTNVPATDNTFKLTIVTNTGAVGGFFPHTDGSKTNYIGIILQKGANKGAFGYFLTNVPRNAPAGVSGGISVSAN